MQYHRRVSTGGEWTWRRTAAPSAAAGAHSGVSAGRLEENLPSSCCYGAATAPPLLLLPAAWHHTFTVLPETVACWWKNQEEKSLNLNLSKKEMNKVSQRMRLAP